MSIPYSLILRQVRPGKPEQGNKTYPAAQYRQVLDLSAMAAHMTAHSSKYDKGDIMAVVTQLASCIREQLLLGNKVTLGDLGSFSVGLDSKAAPNAEEFSTSQIKRVLVRWSPSNTLSGLEKEASFEYVSTRKAQDEARKAEKELLNNMATIQPGQNPDDEGTGDDEGGENLGE
jgi:predicted histone-like DNA-binding protein